MTSLLLLLLSAAAAASASPGKLETYKDWIVGCDNGRACQAVGLMPADDYESATIVVERAAGGAAPPDVTIMLGEGAAAALSIDGRRFAVSGTNETGFKPADPSGLIAALLAGKKASVVDSSGKSLAALSVSGASAALLYIDDKQGRLGSVTALVRRGPAPASAIPAPPALPVVTLPPRSSKPARKLTPAQLKAARGENACEKASEESPPESHRLDAGHTLVLVPLHCGSGAYNFLSEAMILDEAGKARPANFSADEDGVYNADYDDKTRRLGTYFKGRGVGDCGVTRTWAWDGSRFRLTEQAEMGECRGSIDYITTWRAQVR